MLLLVDAMGKRYGKLPSEIFKSADTFDLMVMDVAVTYEQHLNNKHNKKVDQSMYDVDALKSRMDKVRNDR